MKGPALIIVILSLFLVFMLAGESASMGALNYRKSEQQVRSILHHYEAESQLSVLKWNLMQDISLNKNRNFGQILEEEEIEERFRADGRIQKQELGNKVVTSQITDAIKGFNLQGRITSARSSAFRKLLNVEEESSVLFLDELPKYTQNSDINDLTIYDGYDLPRKSGMEYEEEIYWIPGSEDFVDLTLFENIYSPESLKNLVRPFIPKDVRVSRALKSNFFAADLNEITMRLNLSEEDTQLVEDARRQWMEEGVSLQETMPELYTRAKRYFSFNESGVYNLKVTVTDADGFNAVSHEEVVQISARGPKRSGKFKGIQYWRRTSF